MCAQFNLWTPYIVYYYIIYWSPSIAGWFIILTYRYCLFVYVIYIHTSNPAYLVMVQSTQPLSRGLEKPVYSQEALWIRLAKVVGLFFSVENAEIKDEGVAFLMPMSFQNEVGSMHALRLGRRNLFHACATSSFGKTLETFLTHPGVTGHGAGGEHEDNLRDGVLPFFCFLCGGVCCCIV